jgi:hypothetical protein
MTSSDHFSSSFEIGALHIGFDATTRWCQVTILQGALQWSLSGMLTTPIRTVATVCLIATALLTHREPLQYSKKISEIRILLNSRALHSSQRIRFHCGTAKS